MDMAMFRETIERIEQMERYFDALLDAMNTAPDSVMTDEGLQQMYNVLCDYSDSGLWLDDFECDERGELPAGLKRGVLSEDGLYNLICDIDQLMQGEEEAPVQ